jgi:MFS family permease
MKRAESAERKASRHEREAKELAWRERELARPLSKSYLWYLFLIISLAYITDEVASIINIQFQSNIVREFFVSGLGYEYTKGLTLYQTLGMLCSIPLILIFVYKPLSDRLGRKPFLIVNTLFIAVALLIVYLSNNIAVFMIGSTLIAFFTAHDIHVVYILESAPKEKRATFYYLSKGLAVLGTEMIPLSRYLIMGNASEKWHLVYLVPAIFGFIASLIALLSARESQTFLRHRIAYLESSDEERADKSKDEKESQGGLFEAIKFSFRHKQMKNLLIASAFFLIAAVATSTYQTIMKESALMSEEQVTYAFWLYPIGNAICTIPTGYLADRLGRKKGVQLLSIVAIFSYGLFFYGSVSGLTPLRMGLLAGLFVGSYWSAADILTSIMISESAPTNLRSSCLSVEGLFFTVASGSGSLIVAGIQLLLPSPHYLGLLYFLLTIPSVFISLVLVNKNVGETKGLDMDAVNGDEWDDKDDLPARTPTK